MLGCNRLKGFQTASFRTIYNESSIYFNALAVLDDNVFSLNISFNSCHGKSLKCPTFYTSLHFIITSLALFVCCAFILYTNTLLYRVCVYVCAVCVCVDEVSVCVCGPEYTYLIYMLKIFCFHDFFVHH